jgi:Spy/CpxP family protein refolding chaperone
MHGPMGHLLRGLDLREEQRAAIKEKLEAERPNKPSREEIAPRTT